MVNPEEKIPETIPENSNSENNQENCRNFNMFLREPDIILKYTVKMQNIVILYRVKFFFRQFFQVMNMEETVELIQEER